MPSLLTLSVSPVVPPVPAARVPFGPAAFCLLRRMLRLWKKDKEYIKGGLGFWEMPILQSIILVTYLMNLIRTFLK